MTGQVFELALRRQPAVQVCRVDELRPDDILTSVDKVGRASWRYRLLRAPSGSRGQAPGALGQAHRKAFTGIRYRVWFREMSREGALHPE